MALFVISYTRDTRVTRTVLSSLLVHLFFAFIYLLGICN